MPQEGKNKGNKNAELPPGQRKRVQFSVSISGKRLNNLIKYLQVTYGSDEEVTDEEIARDCRMYLDEWIDKLYEGL